MIWLKVVGSLLLLVVLYDLLQKKHAILRNFPVLGHFRYWFESVGPELRQYIVTSNDEERPFSRDQRRWIYTSSKGKNNYFGFGTDNDLSNPQGYQVFKHAAFPVEEDNLKELASRGFPLPCIKVLGGYRNRPSAFRPQSLINISGMSFGSLSGPALEAMNRGALKAGCLHNTGEGGIAPCHQQGADLVWQIGSGYFGCRTASGGFDKTLFREKVAANPVRAIEIKLSQGAKPGLGGVLPGAKVTKAIAAIRGIPVGVDCISPNRHQTFDSVDQLLDFVEELAQISGLPVGIKSAVGELEFWADLAHLMATDSRAVDFITIDGGEGGTGAAPLVFSDHVAQPFRTGFSQVYRIFAEKDIQDRVVFVGSGLLGFPDAAMEALALGCDLINVGREAMLAVGCIQAQRCHTGHCPSGVATQNRWLQHGLDPHSKAVRTTNYIVTLRKELTRLAHAMGKDHPSFVSLEQMDFLSAGKRPSSGLEHYDYLPGWGLPAEKDMIQLDRKTNS